MWGDWMDKAKNYSLLEDEEENRFQQKNKERHSTDMNTLVVISISPEMDTFVWFELTHPLIES